MKFGKQFRALQRPRWKECYVDYKRLKVLIRQLTAQGSAASSAPAATSNTSPALRRRQLATLSIDGKKAAFEKLLKKEAQKVENHFGGQQRKLTAQLQKLQHQKLPDPVLQQTPVHEPIKAPAAVADDEKKVTKAKPKPKLFRRASVLRLRVQDTVDLVEFFKLNAQAVDKICKKFDKKLKLTDDKGTRGTIGQKLMDRMKSFADRIEAFESDFKHTLQSSAAPMKPPTPSPNDSEDDDDDDVGTLPVPTVSELLLDTLPVGEVTKLKLVVGCDPMGDPLTIPVIVAKGKMKGPVLGLTAALHGNELNGVPIIWQLFRELDATSLHGTIVACPMMNPPGYMSNTRYFHDGQDLNRVFPGKKTGNCGQQYARLLMKRLICHFDYLIDLHTASFGRVNSLYVRADMNNQTTRRMALLQNPQIIVHNTAPDGSLRSAAMSAGIPAITVEIGDPQAFNIEFVRNALLGVENILSHFHMLPLADIEDNGLEPQICAKSYWLYAQLGGVLTVTPEVTDWVEKGQVIATVRNVFGEIQATYRAPEDGIVVGKSVNPRCFSGDRLIHLGIAGQTFAKVVDDGHT